MRVLVTNDDGIESEGVQVLARHLAGAGHQVVVVAPDRDWSGASAALGTLGAGEAGLSVQRVTIDDAPGVEAWALAGPPAMTVVAGRLGAFGPEPDVVVSGINAGLNTGRAILHSGTVGAALAAQNFGLSGLSVSLEEAERWHWETAAGLAVELLHRLAEAPPRSVLNLNVPGVAPDRLRGLRWGRLAPFGAVRAAVSTMDEGHLQFELRPSDYQPAPDTDQGLVDAGYASVTTVVGVVEAWPPDEGLEATTAESYDERVVPGADLHPVHRIPDGAEHRSLRRPVLGDG